VVKHPELLLHTLGVGYDARGNYWVQNVGY
jgi:hypothetical protein